MGTCDLPDMYALSPQAFGIHIRQITHVHVTTITYRLHGLFLFLFLLQNLCEHVGGQAAEKNSTNHFGMMDI